MEVKSNSPTDLAELPARPLKALVMVDPDTDRWLRRKAKQTGTSISEIGFRVLLAAKEAEKRAAAHRVALSAGLEPRSGERRSDAA